MERSSFGDVDLLFVALHEASLQCSQKSFMRYQMNRGLYFYDQYNRVSRIGGIHRYKRHSEDLNEALNHVRIIATDQDNEIVKIESPSTTINRTPSPIKQHLIKQTNEGFLRRIQTKLNASIVPEVLFKELDFILEKFEDKSKRILSTPKIISSIENKFDQTIINQDKQLENDFIKIEEVEDEDQFISSITNLPKVSLPSSLIIQLHLTWEDLIQDTKYTYKIWRTKVGEDSWNRYIERKRLEQINIDKQRSTVISKQNYHRTGSRTSVNSIQKHSLTDNNIIRSSRVSFLKTNQQTSLESLNEPIKTGIHIEFKLSTQNNQTIQQQSSNQQKGIIFDVPKPIVDFNQDIIILIQQKCKRLLTEMKQKILSLNDENCSIYRIYFYGDNQYIRNKNNLLTLNELARRQKSKFIYSILRREIPEKYNIEIEIPENKHKSYIQLNDGSIQIYYPSGRLSVLRFNSPNFTTLFFDDTDIKENQFIGLVTSTGNVLIMQPNLYARFITDNQYEKAYLCYGQNGIIEKQIQYSLQSNDNDDNISSLYENSVQLQLNSFMQLEFNNSTNINFAFSCEKQEFKFDLGIKNNKSKILDKQQIQIEKLLNGEIYLKELPFFKELHLLRKKIKFIFNHWLQLYRITLGIMDIQSYCLPDFPKIITKNELISPIIKSYKSKSAKSPRDRSISTKSNSTDNEFLQPNEKQKIIRTLSARKSQPNIIKDAIIQFNPQSNNGKILKQNISSKKKSSSTFFPSIKTQTSLPIKIKENCFDDIKILLDIGFACPNIIREYLIENIRISSILYDKCTCRIENVPLINDLEFDKFIELTNYFNSKQLIVIGIINSNINDKNNKLNEILFYLHNNINYGRNQICLCRLSINDHYKCFLYDLSKATKQSSLYGPLLLRRHNIQPGFILIYQHGQLIFADQIFNGYTNNLNDLIKQLNYMKQQQTPLPDQFKFISNQQNQNSTIIKSI